MSQDTEQHIIDSLLQELRRGTIVLSVLSRLNKPQYGYSLVVLLEEKGIKVEPGTLYPLLRRLEKQGLLRSSWDTNQSKPRKYYEMSELGQRIYKTLRLEWKQLVQVMNHFIEEDEE